MAPFHRRRTELALPWVLAAGWIAAAGCKSIRGTEPAKVSASQVVSSAYWFRGTPRSLTPVTQGDLVVNSPMAFGGTFSFVTWYNVQLTNRTGDAVFPDGSGGEATEIDLVFDYARKVGDVDLSVGGIGYHFPDVGPTTKEAYVGGSFEALGISLALTAYYDIDLLDDYYLLSSASRGFELDERWSADLALLVGYMSDDQAGHYFGRQRSGFSDVLLTGGLEYHFDENASVFLKAAGVSVPDDELADSLDGAGLDDSGLWFTLGAAWGL